MKSRWLAYSFALLGLMLFGAACKGEGEAVGAFLEVLQTSPPDRSTATQVETRIGFQIDASIDPATLTDANFFVTHSEGTRVVGALAIGDEPSIAVLTPDEPLSVITDYTATITTGLSSSGGVTLEQDFIWRFMTLDSEWGETEWVEEPPTGSSSKQQIAIDGQSNALAVWEHSSDPAGSSIWANRYTRISLWEAPEPIDTGNGVATAPQLATDAAGNGFAVWQENFGSGNARVWTNRYVVDQGWGAPELLQNGDVTTARSPAVAAEPEGNAIAIWIQQDMDSSNQIVWSNRYVPGSGWGAAEPIDDMPTPSPLTTAVGMDAGGNAIAMWTQQAFPGEVIWANRYTPGLGWGTAELIEADEATIVRSARLTVGSTGDAFVIWGQDGAEYEDVWSTRFSGSAWGTPERIDGFDGGDTVQADVAVDGMGIAHAVWSQSDVDFRNIWASQYTRGSGWGASELIESPNEDPAEDADATTPRVAVNTAGNAFVVWRQTFDDWGSIWSNHLDPDTGWMTAELIEPDARAAKSPKIAVDENRHAHALWLHSFATSIDWVRTNRFE
jgi:hypothetical protein